LANIVIVSASITAYAQFLSIQIGVFATGAQITLDGTKIFHVSADSTVQTLN
jgi:hypothetical protein